MNDPFGRMARRGEAQYAHFEEALLKADITTDEQLDEAAARIQRNMAIFAVALLALILVDLLLLPGVPPLITILAVLAAAWMLATLLRTREFIRRYRDRQVQG